ncbi:hypothetical protein V5799_009632 [Amblyomma americanum]|uniref:Protein kinase domain-containing protein n=1 Tax=Amblyomma americanum TaxID=6943 RepID=A0AAQ4F9T3_AMBAM
MDGLHLPLDQNGDGGHFKLVYQPPPVFYSFPGVQSFDPSDPSVKITGKHFAVLNSNEPLAVRVSGVDHSCNLTSISSHSLVCRLGSDILSYRSPYAFEVTYERHNYPIGNVILVSDSLSICGYCRSRRLPLGGGFRKNLAARNCMLNEDLVVRVADFGMSRDIYEKDYYSGDNTKTKLPVRWMAPESLEKDIHSHKTDVRGSFRQWSYGVLLWEFMRRGVTSYPDVNNWDIVQFLRQGHRMEQPEFCPKELYNLKLQCWQKDPKMRPPFKKLVTAVANMIDKLAKEKRRQKSQRERHLRELPA